MAAALGLREESGLRRPPAGPSPSTAGGLVRALRDRRLLLVLDNCEHVVDAVAPRVAEWLRALPGLTVLATSQEPLGVAGETVWPVPPLEPADALELFILRAAAAGSPPPPGADAAEDRAAMATICRRLDGIPLALEMAATRVRALGPRELAARLDDRFTLLDLPRRGAPARQQTLRAVIDWSWELCDETERAVLRRLSVLADGGDLEAVEAVCSGDGVPRARIAGVLARLVDRSLVHAVRTGDEVRYRLLESVAAYCAGRLRDGSGGNDDGPGAGVPGNRPGNRPGNGPGNGHGPPREAAAARARHRAHFLALAREAEPKLRGPRQQHTLRVLDRETANLRRALREAVADGAAAEALELACCYAWYGYLRGRVREARRWLDLALTSVPPASSFPAARPPAAAEAEVWRAALSLLVLDREDAVREAAAALDAFTALPPAGRTRGTAWARWLLGFAQWGVGGSREPERRVLAALGEFRTAGDRWGTAAALATQAMNHLFRSELGQAEAMAREALELFTALGDGWGRLQAAGTLSSVAEILRDYPEAERLARGCVRIAEDLGLWAQLAEELSHLGRLAMLRGDHGEAERLHRRGLALAREHSLASAEQYAEIGLALSLRRRGEPDAAERLLLRWVEPNRRQSAWAGLALVTAELGFVAELRGDAQEALLRHREGLAAAAATADPRAVALACEGLAGAHLLAGRPVTAARLLGAAHARRVAAGAPLPPEERG
ncbi:ATP-binding protein, partial [Streptomyces sp. YIM 98790]|uniref:ATP-binding protein n=1 Tax=Streptomyces sp. YIM 98790 TaxID=2689077 RepID=UPI0037DD28A9